MIGGLVALIVLGLIALARLRLGDASYEKIVLTLFAWLFGATAAFFIGAYIYSHVFR
jgi:hypothetical protein